MTLRLLWLLAMGLFFVASAARAQLQIEITGATEKRTPVAIAPFAGENHLDLLRCEFRHKIKRHARGCPERLVFVPRQTRERVDKSLSCENDFVMLRADLSSDLASEIEF